MGGLFDNLRTQGLNAVTSFSPQLYLVSGSSVVLKQSPWQFDTCLAVNDCLGVIVSVLLKLSLSLPHDSGD